MLTARMFFCLCVVCCAVCSGYEVNGGRYGTKSSTDSVDCLNSLCPSLTDLSCVCCVLFLCVQSHLQQCRRLGEFSNLQTCGLWGWYHSEHRRRRMQERESRFRRLLQLQLRRWIRTQRSGRNLR